MWTWLYNRDYTGWMNLEPGREAVQRPKSWPGCMAHSARVHLVTPSHLCQRHVTGSTWLYILHARGVAVWFGFSPSSETRLVWLSLQQRVGRCAWPRLVINIYSLKPAFISTTDSSHKILPTARPGHGMQQLFARVKNNAFIVANLWYCMHQHSCDIHN
jgi:hypothetical protein